MSRADLARKLGLNRSSSGQIVQQLTESGLVQEIETSKGRRDEEARAGRPGVMLALAPEAVFFIGIEIGVEYITVVQADLCGQVTAFNRSIPFEAKSNTAEAALRLAFKTAFGEMDKKAFSRCKGVGLSAPAHISSTGFVSCAPIIGWRNIDLARIARAELPTDVPVIIENDTNAFAIGNGYKQGCSGVILFLHMETGVGGGILIDGKLFRGGHGLAGEIGHIRALGGNEKELEQLIGREQLLLRYRNAVKRPDAEFAEFLAAARDRVPATVSISEDWARNLACALSQACRLIDPNRIVLGGSVADLYPLVSARVAAYMVEGQRIAFPAPDIVVDDNPEYGSAFGAACLLHQRFLSLANEDLAADDTSSSPPRTRHRLQGKRIR